MTKRDWTEESSPARTFTAAQAAAQIVIVVGLDGSTTSWHALAWASGQARRSNAQLVAAFVGPEPISLGIFADTEHQLTHLRQMDAKAQGRAIRDQAERIATEARVPLLFVYREGDVKKQLLAAAMTYGADLLVVGSSNRIMHRLVGSVGRRLAHCKRVPVVIVP